MRIVDHINKDIVIIVDPPYRGGVIKPELTK